MAAHDDDPIKGRYHRRESIGRGSFGEVWRVWDSEREQEMALKILIPLEGYDTDARAEETDRQRFWREAKATWAFHGKNNIVLVYDYGEHRGRPFLVMELMQGETLRDLLKRTGRLDPPRAVEVLDEVAQALGAAHRARLVHRDVKPANIFVGADDKITLLDFGMLGSLDPGSLSRLTERGQFSGTLEYMAPERFPGDDRSPPEAPSSPPGDIYSLACVFHQCLTGELPFVGADPFQLRWKHRRDLRPQPGAVDPDLAEFDGIVGRGLAVDPAARPQTAAEFVAGARDDALYSWRARRSRDPKPGPEPEPPPIRPEVPAGPTRQPEVPVLDRPTVGAVTEAAPAPGVERPTRPAQAQPRSTGG